MYVTDKTDRLKALERLLNFPSHSILFGPSPIKPLATPLRVAETARLKLSVSIENPIFLKRDDLTPGFGNKTRKLGVILADAIAAKADCIIPAGGPQSNHCRQTAQFAAELCLETHLIFGTTSGQQDFEYTGNQVANKLFNVKIHTCKKPDRPAALESLAAELRKAGKRPYIIPVGGSNHLGAVAYAKGFCEFLRQAQDGDLSFKRIVFATSSGGTQAGLVLGAKLRNWQGEILGISIDQVPDEQESNPQVKYVKHMVDISNQALEKLGSRISLSASDFNVNYDYLQDGYGVVGDYDRIGVRTLSNHGILSGPVYSGRAFGALLDLISKGVIPDDGQTLFWHTGGAWEIEVYKDEIFA
jgi:D-cysteine desulfhydrase